MSTRLLQTVPPTRLQSKTQALRVAGTEMPEAVGTAFPLLAFSCHPLEP